MRIALVGYGRMGRKIEELLSNDDTISWRISADNKDDIEEIDPSNTDVAIDFSVPDAAFHNVMTLLRNGVPVVSGTTAWLDKISQVHKLCNELNGSFLYASNFSIAVNIFFSINERLAQLTEAYPELKPSIAEWHHLTKLDAPSGTAITIAEQIISQKSDYKKWSLVDIDDAKQDDIPVRAYRESDVPGTHEVTYDSPVDQITIRHMARGREGFAQGAILAAKWLSTRKGIFTMKDVLGL